MFTVQTFFYGLFAFPIFSHIAYAHNYSQVLNMSFMFYEAQRVGKLPYNNRIKWRNDAFLSDRSPKGTDITGGWLDAGDNIRFNFPMSWSAGVIALSLDIFENSYKKTKTYDIAYDNLKWVSDYLIKCYFDKDKVVSQIGNAKKDHQLWTRPEYITEKNDVYILSSQKPGSDLAGSVSGFLALMSKIAKKRNDDVYAKRTLYYSKLYYEFAIKYKGKYSDSNKDVKEYYQSSSFYDDIAWGAICIYHTTKEQKYLQDAIMFLRLHWKEEGMPWKNYDWDSNSWGVHVLLSKYTSSDISVRTKYEMQNFIITWLYGKGDGYNTGPKFTPQGLAWFTQWGVLRHTSNAVFLMLVHEKLNNKDDILKTKIYNFAKKQINYILGDGGRSYVIGYGINFPKKPHHRSSSCRQIPYPCDWSDFYKQSPNPSILYGALVGGPDINDNYKDDRTNYITNEVATDFNAGFTGALAGLLNT